MLPRMYLRGSQRTVAALCALGLALCALLWSMVWLQTRSEFAAQQKSIGQDLANLSLAVGLSARHVIENSDVSLKALRAAFIDNGYRHHAVDFLREAKRTDVHTTFLAALDARGYLVVSNKDWSGVASTDFSDRTYFSVHASSIGDDLHISKVFRNRLNGEWRLFLSRRLSNWDGSFAGAIVIGIDPLSLAQPYRGLELGDSSGIAIVGDDGLVVAGTGILLDQLGTGFKEGRRTGGQDNSDGTGIIHEIYESQPRTLFYRRIGDHPLDVLVVAGGSRYASLSRDNSRRYRSAAGIGTVIIAFAVALAARAHLRNDGKIRAMAFTDSLTGLANRAQFRAALEAFATAGQQFSVLLLDLDGFKGVNDRYGHAAGDQVLIEVAARLRRKTRESDLLVRLGGDEFAVICSPVDPAAELEIGQRLCRAMAEPFLVDGRTVDLGVSVGIATTNGASVSPQEIVRQADIALYAAKRAGRGTAIPYREKLDRQAA